MPHPGAQQREQPSASMRAAANTADADAARGCQHHNSGHGISTACLCCCANLCLMQLRQNSAEQAAAMATISCSTDDRPAGPDLTAPRTLMFFKRHCQLYTILLPCAKQLPVAGKWLMPANSNFHRPGKHNEARVEHLGRKKYKLGKTSPFLCRIKEQSSRRCCTAPLPPTALLQQDPSNVRLA